MVIWIVLSKNVVTILKKHGLKFDLISSDYFMTISCYDWMNRID